MTISAWSREVTCPFHAPYLKTLADNANGACSGSGTVNCATIN